MIRVSRLLSPRIASSLLGSVLLLYCIPAGYAQRVDDDDLEGSLNALIDGALTVHINARIIDEGENQDVWNMTLTRFTIGGRSVTVYLEGKNIRVLAEFTPYWESEDQLLLVAQGQTWIGIDEADGDPEYRTAFTTLPIRLGEPILFLPLGSGRVPVDTERFGLLNIELELNVERYQS